MVKVRIQLLAGTAEAAGPLTVASNMLKTEGIGGMYKGIDSALTRQVIYTGSRLGLFDYFIEAAKVPGEKMPVWKNSVCALAAGGIAAVIGNPADLALIRMQADAMLPEAERRGYRHVGHALSSIASNEGFMGLFNGAGPTAARAMALNLGMLGGNAQAKQLLSDAGLTGSTLVFGASAIAGFFASAFSLPFDFVKTQMQKQKPDPVTGELQFKSSMECVMKTMAEGGPLRFYAGFPTFYVRIAPHAMITLIMQDQIKGFWAKNGL
jgi:solute carrier family 25 oxoglutarate transporter 11